MLDYADVPLAYEEDIMEKQHTEERSVVCRYNQKGFFKFKQNCRNIHENKACPEEDICKNKQCEKRHPKVCRNFSGEGNCPFGSSCAYKHFKEINKASDVQSIILKHSLEVKTIQEVVNKLKIIILKMETNIKALTEEMLVKQQINIGEIVKCVLTVVDSSQPSKLSPVSYSSTEKGSEEPLKEAHEKDISVHCDYCNFDCVNEELMIAHMSGEHEESPFCYLCGKYFGTKKFLKNHSITTQRELQNMTESECEERIKEVDSLKSPRELYRTPAPKWSAHWHKE